jgi:uncharacterized protein YdeI (YjbR/CyaY-like superfamily)
MPTKFKRDPKIDKYIKSSAPFAQLIVNRLRKAVHAACPQAEETIKWGSPFFLYRGKMLCGMAEFKAHCKFFIWNWKPILKAQGKTAQAEMQKLKHIFTVSGILNASVLKELLKHGMKLNEPGAKPIKRANRKLKPPLKTPPYLMRALRGSPKSLTAYEALTPGKKRLYVEWITEAKTDATREKRIEKAVENIAAGKAKYWE